MGNPEEKPDVQLNVESVRELASSTRKTAHDLGSDHKFKNLHLTAETFGGFEGGAAIAQMHGMAHKVVSETIAGVEADLVSFGSYLDLAVSDLQTTDDLSAAALARLSGLTPGNAADAANENARSRYVPEGHN